MYKMYNTDPISKKTYETIDFHKGNWINMINPSEKEIKEVCFALKIEEDFIRYALDPEEKARIEIEEDDGTILFILDTPSSVKEDRCLHYYANWNYCCSR